MLGLKAARRRTAPISSATPVRRASRTASSAGPSGAPASVGLAHGTPPEHVGAGGTDLALPALGHPDRAVGLGDHGGARHRGPGRGGQRGRVDGRGDLGAGPQGDDLDGIVGPGVAVAPAVLVVEVGHRRRRSARGSAPRTGSPPTSCVGGTCGPTRHRRRRPAPASVVAPACGSRRGRRGRRRGRRWSRGVGHDRTRSRWRRRGHQPDGGEHAGPGRHEHRGHPQRVGQRAGVQRPGPAEGHERQRRRVDAPLRPTPPGGPGPWPRRPP